MAVPLWSHAGFDQDFNGDEAGGHPAGAHSLTDGPGHRIKIVGAETDPANPYDTPGNQSLMLENATRDSTPNVVFSAAVAVASGVLSIDFLLLSEIDPDGGHFTNPQLQINAYGDGGHAFTLHLRAGRWIRVVDAGGTHTLDQAARVNAPNNLTVSFDAATGGFTVYLNGLKLAARGDDPSRFSFIETQQGLDRVALRPGSSSVTGSRVFIDRVALGPEAQVAPQLPPAANLLPNSDFSGSDQAREVYPIVGEYRDPGAGHWQLDYQQAFHGDRSLRMEGGTPFFWQVLNRDSLENVFSVYLKAAAPGQTVELGFEKLAFHNEGRAFAEGRRTKTVAVGTDWERHTLEAEIDPERAAAFVGMHLFRVWVRPLNEGPVWVDAAQLERERLQPLEYNPRRGDNNPGLAAYRVPDRVAGVSELKIPQAATSQTGAIELTVHETSGLNRIREPVWGGVPFPRGELYDASLIRLYDPEGNELPVQGGVLARWPQDGSIRSLLVDFQPSVPADGKRSFQLNYGEPQAEAAAAIATATNGRIQLDTGPLQAAFSRGRFQWFEALLEYEARIHAFAGKDQLYIEHTFENAEAALNTAIQSMRLRLPRGGDPSTDGLFGGLEQASVAFRTSAEAAASLTQLHEYSGDGTYQVYLD